MKKIALYAFAGGMLLGAACREQDLDLFGDRHEVYFEKFFMNACAPGTETADSTKTSFFFAEETADHMMVDLVVCLVGRKPERDLDFSLEVEPEGTTALPEEYRLEPSYTFRSSSYHDEEGFDAAKDTIRLRINRSARLDELPGGIRLVVRLAGNEKVGVGQYERSKAVIVVTKEEIQPLWWTPEVEAVLLGPYSTKKYRLFLQNIEGAYELDGKMIEERPSQALKLVRKFKEWLDRHPQTEENGDRMYVNV